MHHAQAGAIYRHLDR